MNQGGVIEISGKTHPHIYIYIYIGRYVCSCIAVLLSGMCFSGKS